MELRTIDISVDGAGYAGEKPSLVCYIPDTIKMRPSYRKSNIVICPGGGYEVLWETEREAVVLKYLSEGFNVFLLNYSVIPSQYPNQLLELARSMKYIRNHSEEFNGDPDKVFICGFSAGGHLAANLGVCWNKDYFRAITGSEFDHKPTGVILAYPVITIDDDDLVFFYNRFIGENPSQDIQDQVSLERQVDSETVPFFMWGTNEDPLIKHLLLFGMKLHEHGVPFELIVYQKGPHGISLANEVTSFKKEQNLRHCSGWFQASVEWMNQFDSQDDRTNKSGGTS